MENSALFYAAKTTVEWNAKQVINISMAQSISLYELHKTDICFVRSCSKAISTTTKFSQRIFTMFAG